MASTLTPVSCYTRGLRWRGAGAARPETGLPRHAGMRSVDPTYRLRTNVRIAMLYLEARAGDPRVQRECACGGRKRASPLYAQDDDAGNAETYIKRATPLIPTNTDRGLDLQFKSCYARILDSKRRFLEAAVRYYELSQVAAGEMLGEEDLLEALGKAVTCAILAAAGPQRSRILATLYKARLFPPRGASEGDGGKAQTSLSPAQDERSARLGVFPVLEKVYLDRILRQVEVESFAKGLAEHQASPWGPMGPLEGRLPTASPPLPRCRKPSRRMERPCWSVP